MDYLQNHFVRSQPSPKISFKDNWMKDLDSEVAGGNEDSQPPTQHNHKGLALCSRRHPAWASEGTPVGPGKDAHGTLGPEQR